MKRYRIAGHSVASQVELPELAMEPGTEPPDVVMAKMERAVEVVEEAYPEEDFAPRDFLRRRDGALPTHSLRTPAGMRLRLDTGVRRIEFAGDDLPRTPLTHALIDFALPCLLSSSSDAVLHGALLESGGSCVAVLGESGSGKSTLAAAWLERGHRFMGDDWFVLSTGADGLLAHASHPSIRLRWEDERLVALGATSARGPMPGFSKRWYSFAPDGPAFHGQPAPLRAVVLLSRVQGPEQGFRSRTPDSQESLRGLLSATICLEMNSAGRWSTLLPLLAEVERKVAIRVLSVGDVAAQSGAIVKEIEELLCRETGPDERSSAGSGRNSG